MTAIHLVSSGKGNVGKSAFATMLAGVARMSDHEPHLIDADVEQQTLSKLLGDRVKLVALSEDQALEEQPDLIWYLAEEQTGDLIVDLGAQTDKILRHWMDERGILEMAPDQGIKILKWWVSDLDENSLGEIVRLVGRDNEINHILVKNFDRVKPEAWENHIEANKELKKALAGPLKSIDFPRLSSNLIVKLRAKTLSFEDVIQDEKHQRIDMLNRGTIMRWMRKCSLQISSIYEFPSLLFDPSDASEGADG